MNIIICGAGEVGRHAAEVLGADGHSVTVIDTRADKLELLEEMLDVRSLLGDGAHANVLREAGCGSADLFIAATNSDEVNLMASSIAAAVGADRTVARIHHSAYFEGRGLDYARHFGVDHLVCPEHTTALAIAQTLRSPGALAVERFAKGEIEIQQLPVGLDAPALGKPLAALKLPSSIRVAAIERTGRTFIPGAQDAIEAGDIITLIGSVETFDGVRKQFDTGASGHRHVMIVGGTPAAVWICRALRTRQFSVRLFVEDEDRAEELAEKLDWVTVLQVDPTDAEVFDAERVDQADVFVTVTDDDESNILLAARAKSVGAASAIAVVQRPTYLHLIKHVGIDWAFSPRVTAVNEIQKLLDVGPVRHVASLAVGIADVYEIHVPAKGNGLIGKPLRAAKFPSGCIVAAIQRGEQVHVPGADDAIAPDDVVVVVGPAGIEKQLRKAFAIK